MPELFDDDDRDDDQRAFDNFRAARDKREHYAALTAELEYRRAAGKLMEVAEVTSAVAEIGTVMRLSLETLPDNLGPMLAHMTDEDGIRALMAQEIERLLDNLSRQIADLATKTERGHP